MGASRNVQREVLFLKSNSKASRSRELSRCDGHHPMRDVLRCMPLLQTSTQGAIGHLMAQSAPELEDGTVSADTLEALGWLLAELGELGAQMTAVGMRCGRELARSGRAREVK